MKHKKELCATSKWFQLNADFVWGYILYQFGIRCFLPIYPATFSLSAVVYLTYCVSSLRYSITVFKIQKWFIKTPTLLLLSPKDILETKRTKQSHGNFTSLSGHFSTNYNKTFHKTEFLMNILGSKTCLSFNWIKATT